MAAVCRKRIKDNNGKTDKSGKSKAKGRPKGRAREATAAEPAEEPERAAARSIMARSNDRARVFDKHSGYPGRDRSETPSDDGGNARRVHAYAIRAEPLPDDTVIHHGQLLPSTPGMATFRRAATAMRMRVDRSPEHRDGPRVRSVTKEIFFRRKGATGGFSHRVIPDTGANLSIFPSGLARKHNLRIRPARHCLSSASGPMRVDGCVRILASTSTLADVQISALVTPDIDPDTILIGLGDLQKLGIISPNFPDDIQVVGGPPAGSSSK